MDYLFLDRCYIPNIFVLIRFYEFGKFWLTFILFGPYQEHTSLSTQSFDKVVRSAADHTITKTNKQFFRIDHWMIDRSDAWGGRQIYTLLYFVYFFNLSNSRVNIIFN